MPIMSQYPLMLNTEQVIQIVPLTPYVDPPLRADESGEQHRFLKDFFTSAIELPWSWTLLSFCASFYVSWTVFAVVWYLLALRQQKEEKNISTFLFSFSKNIICFFLTFLQSRRYRRGQRYGSRGLCGQRQQLHLQLPVLPGDPAHHRVRRPGHLGAVSSSSRPHVCTEHCGRHYWRKYPK